MGSLSRTDVRHLRKADALEVMEAWFRQRYEDPVHRTPYESAEGGYIFIYGGPYNAREVLDEQFYDLLPEAWIEKVVDELEFECMDWTETPKPEDYDDDDPSVQEVDLSALGSEEELATRREIQQELDALSALLAEMPEGPAGIGHNNPPESIDGLGEQDISQISQSVDSLKNEFSKEQPSVLSVLPEHRAMSKFLSRLEHFLKPRVGLAADEFAKQIGKNAATLPFWYGLYEAIHHLIVPLTHWIELLIGRL